MFVLQTLDVQSLPLAQLSPSGHAPQIVPPQSTSVSSWLWVPSLQLAVWHTFPVHTEEAQCVEAEQTSPSARRQFLPFSHNGDCESYPERPHAEISNPIAMKVVHARPPGRFGVLASFVPKDTSPLNIVRIGDGIGTRNSYSVILTTFFVNKEIIYH